jgi:Kef-type K+ transport system membrane component KefB
VVQAVPGDYPVAHSAGKFAVAITGRFSVSYLSGLPYSVDVTPTDITQLAWIALAAVLAPVISSVLGRFAIPGVVIELVLGILLGPAVTHRIAATGVILDFANLGLALLMFLAGYELDLRVVRGRPLRLATLSWVGSLLIAGVVGCVLLAAGHRHDEVVIALALTTTALGTLLPILRDNGVLDSPLSRYVLAVGSVGEFGPIVLIALLLGRSYPALTALLLAGFGLLAATFAVVAHQPWGRQVTDALRHGLHSSSQLPVRVSMLLIVALILLATRLGLDVLLGAFAAGIIVRMAMTGREQTPEGPIFQGKLEAIGFGLFVPVFFIVSGARLDLTSFRDHPQAIAAIPLFLALLVVCRGLPALVCYRNALVPRERVAIALFAATGLPLIVVITTIGTDDGYIASQTAAALVTAGMLSVLVLPAISARLLHGHVSASDLSVDNL